MPVQDDIAWEVLRQIAREWAGATAELDEVRPLVGGSVNNTLALHLADGRKAVIKISPHRVNWVHQHEAHQLELLREVGIPVPQVYGWNVGSLEMPHSFVLMEFVEGVDLARAKRECTTGEFDALQTELAEIVLRMHARSRPHYMRVVNGDSTSYESWPAFFRAVYDPIWQEVEKSNLLTTKSRRQIAKVHDRLDRLIIHDDVPRLVHSDLWATNVLARRQEDGAWRISALLDPNCKFAHVEFEIAYLELFQTITPTFLRTYQRDRRLSNDYHQIRKQIYQLYSLVNHVNLFGQEYVPPLLATLEKMSNII